MVSERSTVTAVSIAAPEWSMPRTRSVSRGSAGSGRSRYSLGGLSGTGGILDLRFGRHARRNAPCRQSMSARQGSRAMGRQLTPVTSPLWGRSARASREPGGGIAPQNQTNTPLPIPPPQGGEQLPLAPSNMGIAPVRPGPGGGRSALALVLGVDLRPDQDDDGRDPDPGHEGDRRAERAVGLVVAGEIGGVPGEQQGHRDPQQGGAGAAQGDPPPLHMGAART